MNLELYDTATFATKLHIHMAAFALLTGALQLVCKKGTKQHKALGWFWVFFMASLSISSFFIHEIQLWGQWSPIHLLSVLMLFLLFEGIRAAQKGNFRTHAVSMSATYVFFLLIIGTLTLLPGRLLHDVLFG